MCSFERVFSRFHGSCRSFVDVLINCVTVLFQQLAPVIVERQNCYCITWVNDHSLFFNSIGEADRALLYPESPASKDLHLILVFDWILPSQCSESLFAKVA